jgi:hypothetical protein
MVPNGAVDSTSGCFKPVAIGHPQAKILFFLEL